MWHAVGERRKWFLIEDKDAVRGWHREKMLAGTNSMMAGCRGAIRMWGTSGSAQSRGGQTYAWDTVA